MKSDTENNNPAFGAGEGLRGGSRTVSQLRPSSASPSQPKDQTMNATPISKLIEVSLHNDASGHTRVGEDLLKAAQAEHAALLAVAEAAEDYQRQAEFERMTGNNADNADKSCKVLSASLANLAAVRGGGK